MTNQPHGAATNVNTTGTTRLLYSIPEAAALTGVGRTVLFREIRDGRLASVAIGQRSRGACRRFVTHDDLITWIDRHHHDATTAPTLDGATPR